MDFYEQFPHSVLNFDESFDPLFAEFTKHKIMLHDVLTMSVDDILRKTSGSVSVIQLKLLVSLLKAEVYESFEPEPPRHHTLISTGVDILDDALRGGISGLVEIFGESSTGKSQMCFQMMKTLSHHHQCVYISTEGGNFQSERLFKMGANLQNIFMINCHDLESQEHILNYQLPTLLKTHKDIRLVIIDSISHHIRVELNPNQDTRFQTFMKNQKYISTLSNRFLEYIGKFEVSIVLTNQISSKPVKKIVNSNLKMLVLDYQLGWLAGLNSEHIIKLHENTFEEISIPTIGLNLWNSCNIRICLRKNYKEASYDGSDHTHRTERLLTLYRDGQLDSSGMATYSVNYNYPIRYKITESGVECIK